MIKKAIVTGATGQFGSYMIEFLLNKNYLVIGTVRRRSDDSLTRIEHLLKHDRLRIETIDILDSGALGRLLDKEKPDELYHAAAQSFVHLSWDEPYHTSLVTGLGTTNILEAIRHNSPDTKIWFAASSEQFGRVLEIPQRETTPFNPLSPYAAAKCYSYHMVKLYRESYNLFACSAIMFNNESPRRGLQFVTRKITDAVAKIKIAGGGSLSLGNLDARRDWSFTGDFVEAAWRMLQQNTADDFVLSSGETHSIKEFLEIAFSHVGLKWENYVSIDEKFKRPNDVQLLLGDSSKARKILGWKPTYTFEALIREMVDSDLERANGLRGTSKTV